MSIKEKDKTRLSPEFVLLGFLYRSPSHGYELHQRLQQQFGTIWHASQSQTYNILKRLESQGFINSKTIQKGKHPARQQLNLNAAGKERFEAWLKAPTKASVHSIRVEFITRMYFTQMYYPENTLGMIQAQSQVVRAGLNHLHQQQAKLSEAGSSNQLALELRIELLESVARWLKRCQRSVKIRPTEGQHE